VWAQIEFTDPSTGQKAAGFCRSDFFSPRPDPLPPTQQVLPDAGLNLRSSPVFDRAVNNKVVTMRGGSTVRVLGGVWENFDPRIGKWWFFVEYEGKRGYAYARYLGDASGGTSTGPVVTTGPVVVGRASPAWKHGVCLAGVGNADANVWQEPTFPQAIETAELEAVKLIPLGDNAKMSRVYEWLRRRKMAFVMLRLNWKPSREWATLPAAARMSTAVNSFVEAASRQLELAYDNGVRYFEVHNEPNTPANFNPGDLDGDGLGTAWMGPGEFAEWFSRVTDALRQVRGDVYLGFPGLSPQGAPGGSDEITIGGRSLLWGTDRWLAICKSTIEEKADWIGVHCYWQFDGAGRFGIENADSGGMYWRRYKTLFPGKRLFITEFSNNGGQIPQEEKGRQYGKYIAMLRGEKAIGAAFAFALYWQSDPRGEGWVKEAQPGKYRVGPIPAAMRAALASSPSTATRVVVESPSVWV
jgi:hypothetical protein